jgi:hypothetical protein
MFLSGGLMAGALPLLPGIAAAAGTVRNEDPTYMPNMGVAICDLMNTTFTHGCIGFDPEWFVSVMKEPGHSKLFSSTETGPNALAQIMNGFIREDQPYGRIKRAKMVLIALSASPSPTLQQAADALERFEPEMDEDATIIFQILEGPDTEFAGYGKCQGSCRMRNHQAAFVTARFSGLSTTAST